MKIDRKLNLTLAVDGSKGKAFVHSMPLDRNVFNLYFLTITKTYAALADNGGDYILRMGPRVARLMLQRVAEADNAWAGKDGVEAGLLGAIRQATNALMPMDGGGWDYVPWEEVRTKGLMDPEDIEEVENAITFFTVCWLSMSRKEAPEFTEVWTGICGAGTTCSSIMDCQNFLATLKPEEITGATGSLFSTMDLTG